MNKWEADNPGEGLQIVSNSLQSRQLQLGYTNNTRFQLAFKLAAQILAIDCEDLT